MRGPFGLYIELVDGAAFDKAESGDSVTQSDAPFVPLLFPWPIGGAALAFLPLTSNWSLAVFAATVAASVVCWGGFALFYYRRVEQYRREFSTRE